MSGVSRTVHILLFFVVLGLAAGLVLAGSAGASSSSPAPRGPILKVGWDTEPDNLNPFVGYEQSSIEIFHLEYDFLTNYAPSHLQTEPGLATSWSHSPNGLVWTFTIRKGVKWQDGVPLTAHDIAFTYTFMMKYNLPAFLSSLQAIKTATAPNDTTVVITCTHPKADILSMWVPILPQHIWGRFHSYTQAYNFANKPPIVGSGPFQVVQWVHGQYIRLVANKDYWGGAPKVDQLIFSLYTDQTTMASDLSNGTIQLAIDLPPAQIKGMQSASNLRSSLRPEGLRLPLLQLLHGALRRQPRAARLEVPQRSQLGGRQTEARQPRLRRLRHPWLVALRAQLLRSVARLALDAAGQRGLHLRPAEGGRHAHRGRLSPGQRRAPEQAGQTDRAAPVGAYRLAVEPGHG